MSSFAATIFGVSITCLRIYLQILNRLSKNEFAAESKYFECTSSDIRKSNGMPRTTKANRNANLIQLLTSNRQQFMVCLYFSGKKT